MSALIPHLKYIEALIVSKLPLDTLKDKLDNLSLPVPEQAIPIILRTLRSEKPDYFDGKNPDPADPDWIRDLQVTEFFCEYTGFSLPGETHPVKGAMNLLDDPLMYRLITSMAIAKMTDEDIEIIVNGKFNMEYSAEDIKLFLHYFFNVSKWTLKERQAYVKTIQEPQLLKYYKIALKGDKDYLLWKLGAAPEKDFGIMLKDMMGDAYYNFKEQSKIKPELAQRWGNLAIKLTDRIDSFEKEKSDINSGGGVTSFEFKIKRHGDPQEDTGAGEEKHLMDLQPEEVGHGKEED